jgi:hypothetical protein
LRKIQYAFVSLLVDDLAIPNMDFLSFASKHKSFDKPLRIPADATKTP